MIGILHGYLLDGSGSNLWTRNMVRALCAAGEDVHLVCQEPHPEEAAFVAEAVAIGQDGVPRTLFTRDTPFPGRCTLHRPWIGDTLPVYVPDRYEDFGRVVPMTELPTAEIEAYVGRNVQAVAGIVERHGVTVLHANHAVLMPTVARRIRESLGLPYAVLPHGSALEYAVRPDARFHRMAAAALDGAGALLAVGEELRQRVLGMFPEVPGLEAKSAVLRLGVDTDLFEPAEAAERPARLERLGAALDGLPRGKSAAQRAATAAAAAEASDAGALAAAFRAASEYPQKRPDADLASVLDALAAPHPTLLFVGRLIGAKGIHAVLAALPRVLETVPAARLVIVGHGPEREPLEALVVAMGRRDEEGVVRVLAAARQVGEGEASSTPPAVEEALARAVREAPAGCARMAEPGRVLFTGYLAHAQLALLLPCADVGVFPSVVKEAGPLVFLEAVAAGVFPVGTEAGGMAASIAEAGRVVDPAHRDAMKLPPDPAALVPALAERIPRALRAAPTSRTALAALAREAWDWRSIAGEWASRLHRLEADRANGSGAA